MRGTHVFSSSQDTRDTSRMTQPEPYSHRPTNRSAGRSIRSSDSPPHSIHQLHYHLGMLPYQERTRLTKEGTTRIARQITQIGSKTGQIAEGELRRMEDYLGKIPCIKESLYPHKKIIYLYSFHYAHILKAILEKHPYRVKIPSTILAPSSQNHIKLIDRLSDPPPSLIDQLSPAELCAPSPELAGSSSPLVLPTGRCFICICVHRLPNCVPTFCKKANHSHLAPKK